MATEVPSENNNNRNIPKRVSALQDLAAVIDIKTVESSSIVLPINVDAEGQVVLPVANGKIDLVLRMVLPDFLQEILDRLDKILAVSKKMLTDKDKCLCTNFTDCVALP